MNNDGELLNVNERIILNFHNVNCKILSLFNCQVVEDRDIKAVGGSFATILWKHETAVFNTPIVRYSCKGVCWIISTFYIERTCMQVHS
jgi:hypothetical protein